MRTYLSHDGESGRLRLVMADYYAGQHEATAFTVVNDDGSPIRGRADLAGQVVSGSAHAGYYIRTPHGRTINVLLMAGERSQVERTPCPRAVSRRRKCTLCAAQV